MRSHLRGGRLATVFGVGALGALGLAACTFQPRYPIDPSVAPGPGAQQILPRYPIHEGDARGGAAQADEATPTPPRRRAAPASQPAEGPPLAPREPVESSDLPPPPGSAAYIVGENGPVLIRAAEHHRKAPSAAKGSSSQDEPAPSRHGRREAKARAPETTTVKAGENLYRISLRTHMSVADLAKLNHIKPPYAVKAGRVLDVSAAVGEVAETSGDEAVHSRHGPGFREETPSELRAEKAEQRRLERQAEVQTPAKRSRKSDVAETAAARKPSPSPSPSTAPPPVAPEDLLPPAPARTAPAAVRPEPFRPPEVAVAPTGGPRPYAEVFGPASGRVAVASGRGRGGRTHEDAAAAVAAAAARHPTLAAAATAANANDTAPVAAPPSGRGRFIWPVRGETISGFGPLASGTRNDGLDLSAAEGDPVHAAAGGEVVYAGGAIPGFGNLVLIKHAGGYVTAYGHLQRIDVAMRQTVSQGQVVGEAGSTGNVAKPELHFEIRYSPSPDQSAKAVDPAPLLPPKS